MPKQMILEFQKETSKIQLLTSHISQDSLSDISKLISLKTNITKSNDSLLLVENGTNIIVQYINKTFTLNKFTSELININLKIFEEQSISIKIINSSGVEFDIHTLKSLSQLTNEIIYIDDWEIPIIIHKNPKILTIRRTIEIC